MSANFKNGNVQIKNLYSLWVPCEEWIFFPKLYQLTLNHSPVAKIALIIQTNKRYILFYYIVLLKEKVCNKYSMILFHCQFSLWGIWMSIPCLHTAQIWIWFMQAQLWVFLLLSLKAEIIKQKNMYNMRYNMWSSRLGFPKGRSSCHLSSIQHIPWWEYLSPLHHHTHLITILWMSVPYGGQRLMAEGWWPWYRLSCKNN